MGVGTTKPTEFGYVILLVLTLLDVHCKCVIRFRTFGAIISSNIFSALFILSSPSETPVKYMLELPVVQHVPQALFLFSLHIFFSVFFRLDYISIHLYLQVYWLFPLSS